jgi:D-3-phosphoglycerate dehydrogenase
MILLTHPAEAREKYYGAKALAGLEALGPVRRNPHDRPLSTDELVEAAAGCRVIVSDRQTPGEAAIFERLPDLAAFVRCAVDIRNVNVAAASRHGVLVTHASAGFVASVAELAVGFMIDLARHVTDAALTYRAGKVPSAGMGRQLKGSMLGIIGYGAIGRYLADLGVAFGMRVLVSDPHATVTNPALVQVNLSRLLEDADFVVCLAVATTETENLMDADAFARMRPDAFFINLSRGNLVDEGALRRALDEGRIAGAALDVGRAPDQMPSPELAARSDVIATPHTGGLTPPAIEHQALETVRQVEAILRGDIPEGAANAAHVLRLKGTA